MRVKLLHIGKTGGTFIKNNIKKSVSMETKIPWKSQISLKLNKEVTLITCSHDIQLDDSICKFVFFIRNPVSRYISGFISRLRDGKPSYNTNFNINKKQRIKIRNQRKQELKIFKEFKTPTELAESLSSNNDVIRRKAEKAMNTLIHMKKDINFYVGGLDNLKKNINKILYVGSQETIESDYITLCKLLKIKPSEIINDEITTHKTPNKYKDIYKISKLGEDNIKEWYKKDYKIIEYLIEKGLIKTEYRESLYKQIHI